MAGGTSCPAGQTTIWVNGTPGTGPYVCQGGAVDNAFKPFGSQPMTFPDTESGVPNPPTPQPPVNQGGTEGAGTGTDPLSTLAAAYMASLAGSQGSGGSAPIVIPPAPDTGGGSTVNWTAIGALAALALVGWAVFTWWMHRHVRKAAA